MFYSYLIFCTGARITGTGLKLNCSNNNNNNNNNNSRDMGEVAPLYGVDPALVLTNPGAQ